MQRAFHVYRAQDLTNFCLFACVAAPGCGGCHAGVDTIRRYKLKHRNSPVLTYIESDEFNERAWEEVLMPFPRTHLGALPSGMLSCYETNLRDNM